MTPPPCLSFFSPRHFYIRFLESIEKMGEFKSFEEFYPFYLSEHSNKTCRLLHFIGTSIVLMLLMHAVLKCTLQNVIFMPIAGYGCSWVGHFFFEKNKPATFKHPLYSLLGDFRMYRDILLGHVKIL